MAASVTAKYRFNFDVVDVPAAGLDLALDVGYTHKIPHSLITLDASSTPAVTKAFSDTITMSGGTAKLDLTALPGPSSTTIDFSGLKVQLFKMKVATTNTLPVTCTVGTNAYNIFGAADGSIDLHPGCTTMFEWNDQLDDVGASEEISFSGDTTGTFDIQLVAG